MLTSLIFSEEMKSRANWTFSNFWARILGFLLKRFIFFCERTSRRAMSRSPSLKSTSRSSMIIPWCRRCSLHQRVKVFCWISFHSASMTALVGSSDRTDSALQSRAQATLWSLKYANLHTSGSHVTRNNTSHRRLVSMVTPPRCT